MSTDPYLGNVTIWAGNTTRVPKGWLPCDGRKLSIFDYNALYSLLGTTWGGDGVSNFCLPNFQSRVAVHPGQGTGLPNNYALAQKGGAESTVLNTSQMAAHTHKITKFQFLLSCDDGPGTLSTPVGNHPAATSFNIYADKSNGINMTVAPVASTPAVVGAANNPIPTLSPCLAMNYIICVNGLYPTRP